ncbi:Wzz/FepE/Etk N-terminal domain-containing protein [Staphylococcus arlettae]|uniref:Wzz/FepE/Etk N-terminal domain-containing protein n=1 Tax=Staphylococcus TaxID=1279 RepID=UPI00194E15E6|nr:MULTISPECIES: Wzz/FepE/Etk N-terminal domain-containing protein [Staphylococcus]MCD8889356.1 capsule biosynthesis protein CapA [Staphylococcus arlettae]QZZ03283.1 capsule biosynthesis protein CapA [Staphylococcus arlettae]
MENTLDLLKLKDIVKKNLKLLLLLPLVFLIISAIITFFFITPKYEASTQVLVNQKESDTQQFNPQQVQNDIQLVNTYNEIIKSPRILDATAKKLGKKYNANDIEKMLTVSNQAETQLLNIKIQSEDKKEAEKIANTIAKVFSNEVPDIMSVDNVSILSKANGTAILVAPKALVNLFTGLALGLLVALIVVVLKELFDKRIKTEEDVATELDLPVLGAIQKFK